MQVASGEFLSHVVVGPWMLEYDTCDSILPKYPSPITNYLLPNLDVGVQYVRPSSSQLSTTNQRLPNMGMEDYTRHQQGIIKRYYQNFDQITWQKLSDLVGDLFLAEGKKRDKLWQSAQTYMEKLEIPKDRIAHILAKKDPQLLAGLVKELMSRK
jgi:hypothetical protein